MEHRVVSLDGGPFVALVFIACLSFRQVTLGHRYFFIDQYFPVANVMIFLFSIHCLNSWFIGNLIPQYYAALNFFHESTL